MIMGTEVINIKDAIKVGFLAGGLGGTVGGSINFALDLFKDPIFFNFPYNLLRLIGVIVLGVFFGSMIGGLFAFLSFLKKYRKKNLKQLDQKR